MPAILGMRKEMFRKLTNRGNKKTTVEQNITRDFSSIIRKSFLLVEEKMPEILGGISGSRWS